MNHVSGFLIKVLFAPTVLTTCLATADVCRSRCPTTPRRPANRSGTWLQPASMHARDLLRRGLRLLPGVHRGRHDVLACNALPR